VVDHYERLTGILRATPQLMQVLRTVRTLGLPDWLVFSGAIYQPVLNHLTGRGADHGIKDYDLANFDGYDLSYEAEDVVIRRVAEAFEEPLRSMVEVRNQARVHLWFEAKFGERYARLSCTADALERFTSARSRSACAWKPDNRLYIDAPFGLDDLFALRLRPNPHRHSLHFLRSVSAALRRWPELVIETEPKVQCLIALICDILYDTLGSHTS
jgi:hypothetical protein